MSVVPRSRGGNSGPLIQPVQAPGMRRWRPVASTSLVIDMVPVGHAPGLYDVRMSGFVTATGTGNFTGSLSWNEDDFGAATLALSGGFVLTSTGLKLFERAAFVSSGLAPIRLTLTPSGSVTGTPRVNIAAVASLIATPPE